MNDLTLPNNLLPTVVLAFGLAELSLEPNPKDVYFLRPDKGTEKALFGISFKLELLLFLFKPWFYVAGTLVFRAFLYSISLISYSIFTFYFYNFSSRARLFFSMNAL